MCEATEKSKDQKDEKLFKRLDQLYVLAGHQDIISWTIFSIFFGANALLIGAFTQVFNKSIISQDIIVSFFGIFLCFIWTLIQIRIVSFQQFYENLACKLEIELNTDINFRPNQTNPYFDIFMEYTPNFEHKKSVKCLKEKPYIEYIDHIIRKIPNLPAKIVIKIVPFIGFSFWVILCFLVYTKTAL